MKYIITNKVTQSAEIQIADMVGKIRESTTSHKLRILCFEYSEEDGNNMSNIINNSKLKIYILILERKKE